MSTALSEEFARRGIHSGDDLLDPWARVIAWAMEAHGRWPQGAAEGARLGFLTGKLKADPTFAAMQRIMPGEVRRLLLALLECAPDEARSSPKGAGEGRITAAEQASRAAPSPEMSAPADGREGQTWSAEQAKFCAPSRPTGNLVPVSSHLRGKPGTERPRPLAVITPAFNRPPRVDPASLAMGQQLRARSILETYRVAGTLLADVTGGMCRTQQRKSRLDARFLELVSAGVSDDMRIGVARTPAEADALWAQAVKEIANGTRTTGQ